MMAILTMAWSFAPFSPGEKVKLPQGATPEGHLGGQDGKVWLLQMDPVRPA